MAYVANRLAYVANSTMWPMWLIAEKSLLEPSKLDLAKEISTGLPRYLLEAIARIVQFVTILIHYFCY